MNCHAISMAQLERGPIPGPCALVRMADTKEQLSSAAPGTEVSASLDLVFNDSGEDFGLVRAPNETDAGRILAFVEAHRDSVPHIVFQCQVGIGRSLAACAAVQKIFGVGDYKAALHRGTHNRRLYRLILAAAGQQPDPEPKISLAVRVKYAPDRMHGFLLAIQRQRYDNWELVFVTDGPNPAAREIVAACGDARVKLVETEAPRGRWGHPYRQRGIEACTGELIGLSNDDNYYVPGYFEQMVNALEREKADLAMCAMLHSYWGWRPLEAGHDVGSWIARRELLARTPWEGDDFFYDARFLDQLKRNAARTAVVNRPLFIHN